MTPENVRRLRQRLGHRVEADDEPRGDLRYSTHYWTGLRSANPQPTCRKGGCGEPACDDSEFCEQHGAIVVAGQAWADGERSQLRGQGRMRAYHDGRRR